MVNRIWPELYHPWRANFKKYLQDCLKGSRSVAINEESTILIVDSNSVFTLKLSNPVKPEQLSGTGKPAAMSKRTNLATTRFEDAQGIAFIARDVAILCNRDANALRILHVTEDGSFRLFTHDPDDRDKNRFAIERPFGVATLWRFDEHEPDSTDDPVAAVAVTEYDKTSLLILLISQDNEKHDEAYSVTRGFRIVIGGSAISSSSLVPRRLRGVAAVPVRKVGIGVLRSRRKAAIDVAEADGDEDAIETAHQAFARDSNKSFMVYVTRDATGEARARSDVVELDLGPLLKRVLMGSPRWTASPEKAEPALSKR